MAKPRPPEAVVKETNQGSASPAPLVGARPAAPPPVNTKPAPPAVARTARVTKRPGPAEPVNVRPRPLRSHETRNLQSIHNALTTYMAETIGRYLDDDGGDEQLNQIERARSISQLLPLIEPLIDAVVEAAGPQAAAEVADHAASLLEPLGR